MIKKINASFEVLSDKEKRREYDTTGLNAIQFDIYEPNNNNNKTHDQVQHDSFHNDNRSDSMYSDYSSDDHNYYETREIENEGITDRSNYRMQHTTITDLDTPKAAFI